MVWVNKECVNRPTQEGMIGGGAMCVCPKCIAERRKQNPPKVCEHGELERKCVHCENDKLEAELEVCRRKFISLDAPVKELVEEIQRLREVIERIWGLTDDLMIEAICKQELEAE